MTNRCDFRCVLHQRKRDSIEGLLFTQQITRLQNHLRCDAMHTDTAHADANSLRGGHATERDHLRAIRHGDRQRLRPARVQGLQG